MTNHGKLKPDESMVSRESQQTTEELKDLIERAEEELEKRSQEIMKKDL
jgi:hypothetical protein